MEQCYIEMEFLLSNATLLAALSSSLLILIKRVLLHLTKGADSTAPSCTIYNHWLVPPVKYCWLVPRIPLVVYQNTPLMDVYHHLGTTTWIKYTSPPIILCNTGSYGTCAITTTCATHTQFRHQRAELRRILPASTGDYQSPF